MLLSKAACFTRPRGGVCITHSLKEKPKGMVA